VQQRTSVFLEGRPIYRRHDGLIVIVVVVVTAAVLPAS